MKDWVKDRKKRGKTSGNGGLRDKTIWGNPVGLDKKKVRKIKRNGKTFEVHSQGDKIVVKRPKRDQAKRNNTRTKMIQRKGTHKVQVKRKRPAKVQIKRNNSRKVQTKRNNVRRVIRVDRSNGRRG